MKKLAFVAPWYGESITGGAEMELRDLAHHLADAGVALEILTTCVKDFNSDWNINYYPEGCRTECGISVRRFPVRTRDTAAFDAINQRLMSGQPVSEKQESIYLNEMVRSDVLCRYIAENQEQYSLFVFIPYMFGTTYFGVQQCMKKAVMIPCLHEESYAHFQLFRQVYSRIAGMIFNAQQESELAHNLLDLQHTKTITMGIGMDTGASGDPERFREKYGIQDPFLLYAGRKDVGKNVDTLLQYFAQWKHDCPSRTKLVLLGGGEIGIPASVAADVIDLGFVSRQDKYDACSASLLLCQPSKHESFSLVIMESWLCGRPVLVSGDCSVTKNFAVESGGGLYFQNYPEFAACVAYLEKNADIATQMGKNGGDYVRAHFSWPVIIDRYKAFFQSFEESGAAE